ncbi:MAG: PAS domain S-box protein [Pseudomonadota bacterium]
MYKTTGESPTRQAGKRLDEQTLGNILAACPVGLCAIEERNFVWVNRALIKMFGYDSEEQLVGKNSRMLYESDEEYERVGAVLYTGRRRRTVFETDARLIRRDGREFEGHVRISSPDPSDLMKGTIAAVTDRTPIREAQADLIESERRFREILENVRLVALCLDPQGNITFCNDFFLETTGRKREEVLGRNWFDLLETENWKERPKRWNIPSAYERIRQNNEQMLPTRNGDLRCIRWNTTIFLRDRHGNVVGLASIGEDITERKRANELLLRTERLKAVGDMAAGTAHNFNNFLQIVSARCSIAQKLLESGDTAQARATIEQISRTGDMAAEMIKRLLDFSKRGDETAARDSEVFDLSHTVTQVVEMTKPWWKSDAEKAGITVSLKTELGSGCLVRGRESELFEVAVNLVKNAVEACRDGGEMRVDVFAEADLVVLRVQDNGVGIHEANLGKVFQPFWTTKGFQGTGMGLSSSYGIVTRHGGEISVESVEGSGATFIVKLPRASSRTISRTPTAFQLPDVRLRILLIDDDETLITTIGEGLVLHGQEVLTATSGRKALAILDKNTVDVVICDLGMEEMNGWEIGGAVHETCLQKRIPKPPFILLTGWGSQVSEQSAYRFSVDMIVSKPVSVLTLLEKVMEALDNAGSDSCHPTRAAVPMRCTRVSGKEYQ